MNRGNLLIIYYVLIFVSSVWYLKVTNSLFLNISHQKQLYIFKYVIQSGIEQHINVMPPSYVVFTIINKYYQNIIFSISIY